jgi:hypothetical protein
MRSDRRFTRANANRKTPDWVPPLLESVASAMRSYSPEVCDRLLTDSSMETVWHTLLQIEVKALPDDLPNNLRVGNWIEPSLLTRDASLNDEACVAFFAAVVIEVGNANKARSRVDIADYARRFADAAKTARLARLDPFLCPPDPDDMDALARAETILAQIAADIEGRAKGHPLVLERRRDKDDDEIRVIVRSIAKITKSIFGKYLYGTVATAARVALEPEIDLDAPKVRDWCAGLDPCQ